MAVATLFAAKFCYPSWDYASAGASFSASLLSILNFHLIGEGDYFQLSRDAQPLSHCWSLSIGEQFYLISLFFCAFPQSPGALTPHPDLAAHPSKLRLLPCPN